VEASPLAFEPAWPELGLIVAAAAWWLRAERRQASSATRRACFGAGLILLAAVFLSPVQTLSRHYLLSAHLVQNVLLAEWAPLLLVCGLPATAVAVLGRVRAWRLLTRPAIALPAWLGTYVVWHVPPVYEAALRHPGSLLHVEHLCYVAAGTLLWWPVVHGEAWRERSGAKAGYVFAAFVLASPIGLGFALLPDAVYGFYERAPRVWGIGPLLDQQVAGIAMSLSEAVVFFGAFAVFFLRFLREEDRREEIRAKRDLERTPS
jgi:cytochrome c oxidase assembly factor CtaG